MPVALPEIRDGAAEPLGGCAPTPSLGAHRQQLQQRLPSHCALAARAQPRPGAPREGAEAGEVVLQGPGGVALDGGRAPSADRCSQDPQLHAVHPSPREAIARLPAAPRPGRPNEGDAFDQISLMSARKSGDDAAGVALAICCEPRGPPHVHDEAEQEDAVPRDEDPLHMRSPCGCRPRQHVLEHLRGRAGGVFGGRLILQPQHRRAPLAVGGQPPRRHHDRQQAASAVQPRQALRNSMHRPGEVQPPAPRREAQPGTRAVVAREAHAHESAEPLVLPLPPRLQLRL
mmetsp:Transcript_81337/g.263879  ORF Transcript_81337/g.263879 Transcript_81337/m.263879 type:complete len:287 (-) Transcript_81337:3620-4480(-)